MHRGGKGANPREHSKLCDRGEYSQQRGNLKDDGYINIKCCTTRNQHKQCKDCADHGFSFNLIEVIGNK